MKCQALQKARVIVDVVLTSDNCKQDQHWEALAEKKIGLCKQRRGSLIINYLIV